MKHREDVVTRKERPVPLPKHIYTEEGVSRIRRRTNAGTQSALTHRNTQHADAHLDATNNNHGMFNAPVGEPFVGIKGQDKAEQILENQHAGKCLNGHLAY